MSIYVANCPRCSAQSITFDVLDFTEIHTERPPHILELEVFCCCRNCKTTTTFQIWTRLTEYTKEEVFERLRGNDSLNLYCFHHGYVCLKDFVKTSVPELIPPNIAAIFSEGATCEAVNCFNAAATMYRLCVDIATRDMLPPNDADAPGLNEFTRRNLGPRLVWLFDNGKIASDLRELATCIREDANDAAHQGTLGSDDAQDLRDFAFELLERIFTEPNRLAQAKARRDARRAIR